MNPMAKAIATVSSVGSDSSSMGEKSGEGVYRQPLITHFFTKNLDIVGNMGSVHHNREGGPGPSPQNKSGQCVYRQLLITQFLSYDDESDVSWRPNSSVDSASSATSSGSNEPSGSDEDEDLSDVSWRPNSSVDSPSSSDEDVCSFFSDPGSVKSSSVKTIPLKIGWIDNVMIDGKDVSSDVGHDKTSFAHPAPLKIGGNDSSIVDGADVSSDSDMIFGPNDYSIIDGVGSHQPKSLTSRSYTVRNSGITKFNNETEKRFQSKNSQKIEADKGSVAVQDLNGESSHKITEFFPTSIKKGTKTMNKALIKGYKRRMLSDLQLDAVKKART